MDLNEQASRNRELASLLRVLSQASIIIVTILAIIAALDYAEVILAPLFLGIVMGLMVLPAAQRIESLGPSPWISSIAAVLLFLTIIFVTITAFAMPVSTWVERAPELWQTLQWRIHDWRSTINSMNEVLSEMTEATTNAQGMRVAVEENRGVETVITLAPQYVAQIMLFLVSLYFFLATRENFRTSMLSFCVSDRLRMQFARIFRDIETQMSRYLLVITVINLGLGFCVGIAMWAIGMQTPVLWGLLAFVLNYVVYLGPAAMTAILAIISLATNHPGLEALIPPAIYLGLNFLESQIVTPRLLGSSATVNPFLVFLSLTFWLWLWGPIGGLIAVPSLLILSAIIRNIVPHLSQPAEEERVR